MDLCDRIGMKEAIIYLLAIDAAEAVTVFVQPVWGIVCHAIVLVALVMHSALASGKENFICELVYLSKKGAKHVLFVDGSYPGGIILPAR